MPETSERIAELRRELESNPASRQFYQLGELLRRAGRAAESASVLRSGLTHHPRYVAAWVSLGRACLDRSQPGDAAAALHEALELDAHNPVAWRLLGEARLGDGDRFGALDAMQHALQLAPGDEVLRAAVDSLASETWPPAAAPRSEEVVPAEAIPPTTEAPSELPAVAAQAATGSPPVVAEPPAPMSYPSAETPPPPPMPASPAVRPAPPPAVAGDLEDPFAVALSTAGTAAALGDVFAVPVEAAGFAAEPFGGAAGPVSAQPPFLADFFEPEAVAAPVAEPAPVVPAVAVEPPALAEIEAAPAIGAPAQEPYAEDAQAASEAEAEPLATPEEVPLAAAADLAPESAYAAAPLEPLVEPLVEPLAELPAAEEPWVEAAPADADVEGGIDAALAVEMAPEPPRVTDPEPAPAPAAAVSPLPAADATRPTLTLARLYLQQQDFPAAIAILERAVTADPDNQEARDLLDLVHDMMAPLPGELPSLSVRERKIAALQGWLASLTLGQERMAR